jgi:hypothetical protein
MRTVFDQCAKQLAREALEGWGHLETQREVLPEVQAIDIAFEPSGVPLPERLGLLGQMARAACMLEPYSEAPSEHDLADCVLRQLAWHRERLRKTAPEERPGLPRPWLWVLSAQPLKKMLGRFGFVAPSEAPEGDEPWPTGFYLLAPAHRVGLVLLPDLPRQPQTLLLRMMGRGGTRAGAIEDAFALPDDDPRKTMIAQLVMRLRIELPTNLFQQEGLMSTQAASLYDQFISNLKQEGRVEGRMEGRMEGRKQDLRRILERRFGAGHAWATKLDACQSEAVLDEVLDVALGAGVGRGGQIVWEPKLAREGAGRRQEPRLELSVGQDDLDLAVWTRGLCELEELGPLLGWAIVVGVQEDQDAAVGLGAPREHVERAVELVWSLEHLAARQAIGRQDLNPRLGGEALREAAQEDGERLHLAVALDDRSELAGGHGASLGYASGIWAGLMRACGSIQSCCARSISPPV